MKKLNLKAKLQAYRVLLGVGVLAIALGIVGVAAAWKENNAPKVVAENGGTVIFNEAEELPPPEEPVESLGALASNIIASNFVCVNGGGGDCTYSFAGKYTDATDTLFVIPNPFLKATSTENDIIIADAGGVATTDQDIAIGFTGATSTVELVRLRTNVTTGVNDNLTYVCGTGSSGFGSTSTRSQLLIDTPANVTGTAYVIESGMVSSTFAGFGGHTSGPIINGFIDAVSSTPYGSPIVSKVYLTPAAPYFWCKVRAQRGLDIGLGGVTSTGNLFDGTYVVRISGQR